MRYRVLTAFLLSAFLLAAVGQTGCAGDDPAGPPAGSRTLQVPRQYDTIQQAVDAARAGDVVIVAAGTYSDSVAAENGLGIPLVVSLDMKSGVEIRGETGEAGDVILVGNPNNPVINCLNVDDQASLIGFTVTGGKSGLLGGLSSPTITNCIFEDNHNPSQFGAGGGMYWDASSPTLINCIFSGNSATSGGGAVFANDSHPRLSNVLFTGNTAWTSPNQPGNGGGLVIGQNSHALIYNSLFTANHADSLGGAVEVHYGLVEMVNCNLTANDTDGLGGAFFVSYGGRVEMTNGLVEDNHAAQVGGGFYFRSSSSLDAENSRILNNSAPEGADGFLREPYEVAEVTLRCCEIDTLQWVGPITLDDEGCE